jgi:hypothetical protein
MALEASDLNDGTILQQTRQNTDARGNIQFEITLPSGRLLKSEFINKDNARKALFAWIESVKEQAVADSNAERLERAAKSRRPEKMDIERRPGDDQPLFRAGGARVDEERFSPEEKKDAAELLTAMTGVVPTETMTPEQERTKTGLERVLEHARKLDRPAEVDPLEFAKAQYDIQHKRVAELKDAERKLWQWSVIIETLEAKQDD